MRDSRLEARNWGSVLAAVYTLYARTGALGPRAITLSELLLESVK